VIKLIGYNCESTVARSSLRNYPDFLFSVFCLKASCTTIFLYTSTAWFHTSQVFYEFTVTGQLCVQRCAFAFLHSLTILLMACIWQQKVAGVLYICISECLHTPDPRLLCVACGPAVSGCVRLKQLLARSFLCACDELINMKWDVWQQDPQFSIPKSCVTLLALTVFTTLKSIIC